MSFVLEFLIQNLYFNYLCINIDFTYSLDIAMLFLTQKLQVPYCCNFLLMLILQSMNFKIAVKAFDLLLLFN